MYSERKRRDRISDLSPYILYNIYNTYMYMSGRLTTPGLMDAFVNRFRVFDDREARQISKPDFFV